MTTPSNDVLRGGSRARLAAYRANLARSLEVIRACRSPEAAAEFIASNGYTSALNHRGAWMGSATHGPTHADKRGDYVNLPSCMLDGLRDGDQCDTGWYADACCDETYKGQTWRLPHGRFIAGYSEAASGYCVLDATRGQITIFEDQEDALRAADHVAEHFAELNREHNERWQEARGLADEIERLKDEARKVRKDWRALALAAIESPNVERLHGMRDEKRAEHAELIEQIVSKRERIAELDMQEEF